MVVEALSRAGGVDYLVEQSEKNPTAFMSLIAKLMPTQLTGDKDNPVAFADVTEDAERVTAMIAGLVRRSDGATVQ